MKFERVYPVELFIRGKSESSASLLEYLKETRPDIIIKRVDESEDLKSEDLSIYKITGFAPNPQMR